MKQRDFIPLNIALLTVSDTRTPESDKSGDILKKFVTEDGHYCHSKLIVTDNIYSIRAQVSLWIENSDVDVIITTGGTGVTGRDGTPEAVSVLFDKPLDGFGEIFRMLSYDVIGTSTIQSRCLAGVTNGTYIFCLPGSPGACKDAWQKLLKFQLDYRTQPCNLVELIPRLIQK